MILVFSILLIASVQAREHVTRLKNATVGGLNVFITVPDRPVADDAASGSARANNDGILGSAPHQAVRNQIRGIIANATGIGLVQGLHNNDRDKTEVFDDLTKDDSNEVSNRKNDQDRVDDRNDHKRIDKSRDDSNFAGDNRYKGGRDSLNDRNDRRDDKRPSSFQGGDRGREDRRDDVNERIKDYRDAQNDRRRYFVRRDRDERDRFGDYEYRGRGGKNRGQDGRIDMSDKRRELGDKRRKNDYYDYYKRFGRDRDRKQDFSVKRFDNRDVRNEGNRDYTDENRIGFNDGRDKRDRDRFDIYERRRGREELDKRNDRLDYNDESRKGFYDRRVDAIDGRDKRERGRFEVYDRRESDGLDKRNDDRRKVLYGDRDRRDRYSFDKLDDPRGDKLFERIGKRIDFYNDRAEGIRDRFDKFADERHLTDGFQSRKAVNSDDRYDRASSLAKDVGERRDGFDERNRRDRDRPDYLEDSKSFGPDDRNDLRDKRERDRFEVYGRRGRDYLDKRNDERREVLNDDRDRRGRYSFDTLDDQRENKLFERIDKRIDFYTDRADDIRDRLDKFTDERNLSDGFQSRIADNSDDRYDRAKSIAKYFGRGRDGFDERNRRDRDRPDYLEDSKTSEPDDRQDISFDSYPGFGKNDERDDLYNKNRNYDGNRREGNDMDRSEDEITERRGNDGNRLYSRFGNYDELFERDNDRSDGIFRDDDDDGRSRYTTYGMRYGRLGGHFQRYGRNSNNADIFYRRLRERDEGYERFRERNEPNEIDTVDFNDIIESDERDDLNEGIGLRRMVNLNRRLGRLRNLPDGYINQVRGETGGTEFSLGSDELADRLERDRNDVYGFDIGDGFEEQIDRTRQTGRDNDIPLDTDERRNWGRQRYNIFYQRMRELFEIPDRDRAINEDSFFPLMNSYNNPYRRYQANNINGRFRGRLPEIPLNRGNSSNDVRNNMTIDALGSFRNAMNILSILGNNRRGNRDNINDRQRDDNNRSTNRVNDNYERNIRGRSDNVSSQDHQREPAETINIIGSIEYEDRNAMNREPDQSERRGLGNIYDYRSSRRNPDGRRRVGSEGDYDETKNGNVPRDNRETIGRRRNLNHSRNNSDRDGRDNGDRDDRHTDEQNTRRRNDTTSSYDHQREPAETINIIGSIEYEDSRDTGIQNADDNGNRDSPGSNDNRVRLVGVEDERIIDSRFPDENPRERMRDDNDERIGDARSYRLNDRGIRMYMSRLSDYHRRRGPGNIEDYRSSRRSPDGRRRVESEDDYNETRNRNGPRDNRDRFGRRRNLRRGDDDNRSDRRRDRDDNDNSRGERDGRDNGDRDGRDNGERDDDRRRRRMQRGNLEHDGRVDADSGRSRSRRLRDGDRPSDDDRYNGDSHGRRRSQRGNPEDDDRVVDDLERGPSRRLRDDDRSSDDDRYNGDSRGRRRRQRGNLEDGDLVDDDLGRGRRPRRLRDNDRPSGDDFIDDVYDHSDYDDDDIFYDDNGNNLASEGFLSNTRRPRPGAFRPPERNNLRRTRKRHRSSSRKRPRRPRVYRTRPRVSQHSSYYKRRQRPTRRYRQRPKQYKHSHSYPSWQPQQHSSNYAYHYGWSQHYKQYKDKYSQKYMQSYHYTPSFYHEWMDHSKTYKHKYRSSTQKKRKSKSTKKRQPK